jgi:hypothetical protein
MHVMYCWKSFDEVYNFALDLNSVKGLHKKLWASKVVGVPILKITKFPTWESRETHHLDVALVACQKDYYKGEGGGFPQV